MQQDVSEATFTTTITTLAAWLSYNSIEPNSIQFTNGQGAFVYTRTEELDRLVGQFKRNEATANATALFDAYKEVLRRVKREER